MAFKVFIDADVILDFTLRRENYQDAKFVVEQAVNGHLQAHISPGIVHIAGYWITKAYGHAKAKQLLLSLLTDVQVIDISHHTTLIALNSAISDIEDALQYYTAIHHRLEYFISEDKNLQKVSLPVLPVYSCRQFIKKFF